MDYKEFFLALNFIKLRVLYDEIKGKIIKTNIFEKSSINVNETKNYITEIIKSYFYGEIEKFDLSILNMDDLKNFQREVLYKISLIPRGKVTTYKRLSELIGKNRAYRGVGNSLAKNPFPIILPCHRVIKSNLYIGNFGNGSFLKMKILKFEGVNFERDYFVSKEFVL